MHELNFIGIDPGISGGLSVLAADGAVLRTTKMPETDRDLMDWFRQDWMAGARAVLERAQATPQMGRSSAFTFGLGYGRLRMALTAAGIPYDVVGSAVWQRALGCQTGGDKNVTKRRAQELFPGVTVTHAVADALLIAEYCRRLHTGALPQPTKAEKPVRRHPMTLRREKQQQIDDDRSEVIDGGIAHEMAIDALERADK